MSPSDLKVLKAAKARADNGDRMDEAIRGGGNPNIRDEYNLSAFIWCARKGHVAAARIIAGAGADIEARDNTQRTAIHHAVLFNQLLFVEFLISIGANLSAGDMHGWTALDIAIAQEGCPRSVRAIGTRLTEAGAPAPKHPDYREATKGA